MRDHAHTLSDFLVPTLSIECEPCGRAGRDTVARLKEKYGDAKLPELLHALASGRPSYPVQPSIIPSDKPPQRLRTSEPGTRRKPPARTGAGRGWCRAPFRAERGIRKRNRRLCRRRACDWHELAAIWRMRANATNCNVINQPFASRSAWRSPPPPAGADERLARRPGCIQANTPAIPKPGDCGSFIVRGKEPRKREGATRRPHRRIGGDLPPVRRHAWAGTGAVPGPGLRHLDRLAMAVPESGAASSGLARSSPETPKLLATHGRRAVDDV